MSLERAVARIVAEKKWAQDRYDRVDKPSFDGYEIRLLGYSAAIDRVLKILNEECVGTGIATVIAERNSKGTADEIPNLP